MLLLYSFRRCPYAIRARMALHYSKTHYRIIEVDLKHKPAELLAISPKATVPVLYNPENAWQLEESWDIMRWALGQSDAAGWAKGQDMKAIEGLVQVNDTEFKHWLDRYKYPSRYTADSSVLRQEAFRACAKILAGYETRLVAEPYLLGSKWSLGDAAVLSFVRQFAFVDRAAFTAHFPRLNCWLEAGINSLLFQKVMEKSYCGWGIKLASC